MRHQLVARSNMASLALKSIKWDKDFAFNSKELRRVLDITKGKGVDIPNTAVDSTSCPVLYDLSKTLCVSVDICDVNGIRQQEYYATRRIHSKNNA
jgi:hypothetical protein